MRAPAKLTRTDAAPWGAALQDIATERRRQVRTEGWTAAHDDEHSLGELARAASAYALAGSWPTDQEDPAVARDLEQLHGADVREGREPLLDAILRLWPWDWNWWKPTNRRRALVKAGALIVAEIERLDRVAAQQS